MRMGAVGLLQPGLAPHPVHVRLRGAARTRRQAKVREALRRLYVGQRDRRRATPATRTTARRPPGTSSARSGSTRCRSAARTTRSGRRCSRQATVHLGERSQGLVVSAPEQQRAQRLRAERAAQRRARTTRRTCATPRSRTAGRSSSDMGPQPSQWGTARVRRAAVDHRGRPGRRSRCTTRTGDPHSGDRCVRADELFDDDVEPTEATGRAGAVPASQRRSRVTLLHADVEHRGRSRPAAAGSLKGSERRLALDRRSTSASGETFRWRSQTRPFKLCRARRLRLLPDRARGSGATLAEVELLNARRPDASALRDAASTRARGRSSGSDGARFRVKRHEHRRSGRRAGRSRRPRRRAGPSTPPSGQRSARSRRVSRPRSTLMVAVPRGSTPGNYRSAGLATAGRRRRATARMVARDRRHDRVHARARTPRSAWLFDADGSQLHARPGGRVGRFADGTAHATVQASSCPADVTGGTRDARDRQRVPRRDFDRRRRRWQEALRKEAGDVHDLANLAERSLRVHRTSRELTSGTKRTRSSSVSVHARRPSGGRRPAAARRSRPAPPAGRRGRAARTARAGSRRRPRRRR